MLYTAEALKEISFPLGGIGTGSIGLAGNGALIDWEIFNRPNKGSLNPYTFLAVRAQYPDGRSITKVLQGDHTKDLTGQFLRGKYNSFGFGPHGGTMCGFPHFKSVTFEGKFPLAILHFSDDDFPADIELVAYNPLIPHDQDHSSLPAAYFDLKLVSQEEGINYTVVFSLGNPFPSAKNENTSKDGVSSVTLSFADKTKEDKDYGDLTIAAADSNAIVQTYWYRGTWKDAVTTFWHEFSTGTLHERIYDTPFKTGTASIACQKTAKKGECIPFSFVLSWNVPNCYTYWSKYYPKVTDENGNEVLWKNYYATKFADSNQTARYALAKRSELFEKTKLFTDSLHSSTLDPAVIDAISSTLSVLKSPTVLRLEDGTFYGWEGVHENEGSCEGTCTHVWSYAYALCFLFPGLERSIRETEFAYDTDENGNMCFRTRLPLGIGKGERRACLDGQMASVIKTYREWKVSGDDNWLRKHWQTVKNLLSYAWNPANPDEWDLDRDGVLEGRQHHTLDMEMFGPSAWLEGMYLAALKAAEKMARHLGDTQAEEEYQKLFKKGYDFTKAKLFNGQYFIHKVDIKDKSYTEHFDCPNYWNDEKQELKYQIADGCEIDQLLGQWHANLVGLGDIFDPEQRKCALRYMYEHLYKPSLRDFPNAWRVFALNDEGGTVMCDYASNVPRPIIPIPYSDECMTGFEYAFAGLLISEGFVEEGLTVVRAIRDRYDGKKRNPWNEIECGSNYARAMSSFALLPIFSGFEYDMSRGHIGFSPIFTGNFRSLFSISEGWGDFVKNENGYSITIRGGNLSLSSIRCANIKNANHVLLDGQEIDFQIKDDVIIFERAIIKEKLEIIL